MLSKQNKDTLCKLALVATTGTLLLHADAAFAQAVGGGGALFSSGTNFLSGLQGLLTSTWARILAIIAVTILGFAWMFGRITMQIAIAVIGGIILVFGAPAIVDSISGAL